MLDNWHIGYSVKVSWQLKKKMRFSEWFRDSALIVLRCFDTVGWPSMWPASIWITSRVLFKRKLKKNIKTAVCLPRFTQKLSLKWSVCDSASHMTFLMPNQHCQLKARHSCKYKYNVSVIQRNCTSLTHQCFVYQRLAPYHNTRHSQNYWSTIYTAL